jgi:hypothetical protein
MQNLARLASSKRTSAARWDEMVSSYQQQTGTRHTEQQIEIRPASIDKKQLANIKTTARLTISSWNLACQFRHPDNITELGLPTARRNLTCQQHIAADLSASAGVAVDG